MYSTMFHYVVRATLNSELHTLSNDSVQLDEIGFLRWYHVQSARVWIRGRPLILSISSPILITTRNSAD